MIELENHYCEGDHCVYHTGSLDDPDLRHFVQEKQLKIQKTPKNTGRKILRDYKILIVCLFLYFMLFIYFSEKIQNIPGNFD